MLVPPILAARLAARPGAVSPPDAVQFPARAFTADVIGYPDGDGLHVSAAGARYSLRLYGMDAPEWGQPYARDAWLYLRWRVFGRPVLVYPITRDCYGRLVSEVFGLSGHCINLLMVLHGFAWYYHQYAPQATHYRDAERLARLRRRGLWQQPAPVPPWAFRHARPRRRNFSHG